jgi:hypothetical protein
VAVNEARLRAFATFIPASLDVTEDLAAAAAVMTQFSGAGLATALLDQIELRLAAHFVALRENEGRDMGDTVEGVSEVKLGGKFGDGLRLTVYGQAALGLDPTGILESGSSDGGGNAAQLRFL